jgi:hypothetical protein
MFNPTTGETDMTTEQAYIEARADILAARITRLGHSVQVNTYGDVVALRSGRFVRQDIAHVGWGRTADLWTNA